MFEMTLKYNEGCPTEATPLRTGKAVPTINCNQRLSASPENPCSYSGSAPINFSSSAYQLQCKSLSHPSSPRTIQVTRAWHYVLCVQRETSLNYIHY